MRPPKPSPVTPDEACRRVEALARSGQTELAYPHLEGQTDEDVMYAAGYAQAVDGMFQMELVRRAARGRLAEVIGRERLAQDQLTRLTAAGGVTVAQMQQLQLDTYNCLADDVLPSLAGAFAHLATDPALAMYAGDAGLAALQSRLAAWNRRLDRASPEPVVYEAFQHFFARQVLADDLDVMFDGILSREPVYIMKLLTMVVSGRTPMASRYLQQGRDVLALRALAQTRAWLVACFGGVEASRYTWGASTRRGRCRCSPWRVRSRWPPKAPTGRSARSTCRRPWCESAPGRSRSSSR